MASNKKTSFIASLEIMLMSIGVLSIAVLIFSSVTYNIPSIYATFRSWLQPPYLYFITNAIIITIVASSRYHPHHNDNHHEKVAPPTLPPPHLHHHYNHHDVISLRTDQFSPYYGVVSIKDVEVDNYEIKSSTDYDVNDKHILKETKSTWTPPTKSPSLRRHQLDLEKVSPEYFSERPPTTSRLAHQRRSTKTNQVQVEKALTISKPKRHDTLENVWKAITERNGIPLTRHLKNSDTWELEDRQIDLLDDSLSVKKSEPYEPTNYVLPPIASAKLKKEPSLSKDELNKRVEAFINKFNEEMRQQSMQDFYGDN